MKPYQEENGQLKKKVILLKSTPSWNKLIASLKNNAGLMQKDKYSRKEKHKNERKD